MDTSCCSLSVKVVFQNSSRLGNRPRCKVPFNQDIAFPSFTAISSDKASFLPNAQYQSLACAASLLTIQTQQENTFARASQGNANIPTLRTPSSTSLDPRRTFSTGNMTSETSQ